MATPPPGQDNLRLKLERGAMLARIDDLERKLGSSIERLDALTRDLDRITYVLRELGDQLRAEDELLAG